MVRATVGKPQVDEIQAARERVEHMFRQVEESIRALLALSELRDTFDRLIGCCGTHAIEGN